MRTIALREIDLSNYAPEELEFVFPRGEQMTIEADGGASIEVHGHNLMSDTFYIMPIIQKISYDIITSITDNGIYDVDITSVDRVKLVVNGTSGKIYIKIIGG